MSSLIELTTAHEIINEENFKRRLIIWRGILDYEYKHLKSHLSRIDKGEILLSFIRQKFDEFYERYEKLKPLYMSIFDEAFNCELERLVDDYNKFILSVKDFIKTIESHGDVEEGILMFDEKDTPIAEPVKELKAYVIKKRETYIAMKREAEEFTREYLQKQNKKPKKTAGNKSKENKIMEELTRARALIDYVKNTDRHLYEKEFLSYEKELSEEKDPQRLELLIENIKFLFVKYKKELQEKKEQELYLDELKTLLQENISQKLRQDIEELIKRGYVRREDYERVSGMYVREKLEGQREKELKEKILQAVEEKGYRVITEDAQGLVYFDTPFGEEYKVRIKFEEGSVKVQFVRYIDVEEEKLSEYEKKVDIERARRFCEHLDSILEHIRKHYHIDLRTTRRIEPEERMFYIKKEYMPAEAKRGTKQDISRERRRSL